MQTANRLVLVVMRRPQWRWRRRLPFNSYATGSEEAVAAAAVSAEPQMAVNKSGAARGEIANKGRVIFFMSLRF